MLGNILNFNSYFQKVFLFNLMGNYSLLTDQFVETHNILNFNFYYLIKIVNRLEITITDI